MKFFIHQCQNCRNRIYLAVQATERSDLRLRFNGEHFYAICDKCQSKHLYNVSEVFAEPEKTGTVTGGIVGGLIGLIGGPLGLLIAGGIGAAIGNSVDDDEQKKANLFN